MSDIRMYCTPEVKTRIKAFCAENGMSMNQLLRESMIAILPDLFEEGQDYFRWLNEVQDINLQLASSKTQLTSEEREKLEARKQELRKRIKGGRL